MKTDVLILGCGIAGATAALQLARDQQRSITLLTRAGGAEDSNSSLAQGGIVGRGEGDDAGRFAADVLRAGAGLAYPPAVDLLAEEGPRRLQEILIESAGVQFDTDESGLPSYCLEAAHSRKRILHVGDTTGRAIMQGLLDRIREMPNIDLRTRHTAVDLLTFPHHSPDLLARYRPRRCHGAYVFDPERERVETIVAEQTILATGGLGQIFLNTTNPPGARGDGLSMAYRAGAQVINAEYVQFHPTALHMPGTTKALISEALRGEGAVLLTPEGRPFMEQYAPDERELATRDVVSRAIYAEMLNHDHPYVLLDIASHRPAGFIRERFPEVHELCRRQNVDIATQPIPVVPAAHYFCGGVLVDFDGRTTLPGLYAVGEVACSGVHGANRLASTSLLEGLVWGARAAEFIRERAERGESVAESDIPAWDDSLLAHGADPALIQGDMQTIRNLMWHYVGLIRNETRLARAVHELRELWQTIEDFYRQARLSDSLIGLRNSILNALIVARAAQRNTASRGAHYREDDRPVLRAVSRDVTPGPARDARFD